MRIYDATRRTLLAPELVEQVPDLEVPKIAKAVFVFEGWVEVKTAAPHDITLKAVHAGMMNFRGPQGEILPPLLLSEGGKESQVTVDLSPGFYPVLLTVAGFFDREPKLTFNIAPQIQASQEEVNKKSP